jgi:hypothetical protein
VQYEAAQAGNFRLVPPDWRQAEWRRDYEQMRDMIFGETLSFDSILQVLGGLEKRINTTASTT